MKRIITFIICVLLVTVSISAHTTVSDLYHHPQCTGWDVYEDSQHWGSNSTTMTVSCGDFSGNSSFKSYITNAVTSWNNVSFDGTDLIDMCLDNTSGTVIFLNKSAEQMSAEFAYSAWAITYRTKADKDFNNHYNTTAGNVEIWVNWSDVLSGKSTRAKTAVPLHELGHVIGLKDIPASVSPNAYLMCNEFGTTYPVPNEITETDIKGAAFILGVHSAHVFTSTYTSHNSSYHRQSCNKCGAYKLYTHTYSNGVCTGCGYRK